MSGPACGCVRRDAARCAQTRGVKGRICGCECHAVAGGAPIKRDPMPSVVAARGITDAAGRELGPVDSIEAVRRYADDLVGAFGAIDVEQLSPHFQPPSRPFQKRPEESISDAVDRFVRMEATVVRKTIEAALILAVRQLIDDAFDYSKPAEPGSPLYEFRQLLIQGVPKP